jgi:hypothetical protein
LIALPPLNIPVTGASFTTDPMNKQLTKKDKGKRVKSKSSNLIKMYDHPGLIPSMNTNENQVFTICQTVDTTYILAQVAITPSFLGFNFSLDQLAQANSWTTVFDQYKIDQVQVTIRPAYTAVSLMGFGSVKVPLLYSVIDYDDNTSPSTLTQMKEYSNCQVSMYETVVLTFQPHIAVGAYDGSVFSSFTNLQNKWIDAASQTVKHYGVKLGIEGGATGQTSLQYFDISIKYKISFRNIR